MHDFMKTAIEIVRRAGAIQKSRVGSRMRVSHKATDIDLVTEVDVAVEEMFVGIIRSRFPDHDILAEEKVRPQTSATHRWIFDPIDGTVNFAHGLPIFCAALALEIAGEVALGAVYDATRDELFTAERGQGAFLNGAHLSVSAAPRLSESLVCTGFPYDVDTRLDELLAVFGAFLVRSRAVRRLGSAAIDMCYVAAGRLDGFWEERLHPWDTAGAALIVREAGGTVTDFTGDPYHHAIPHVVASNGHIHAEMLAAIADGRSRQ